MFPKIEGKKILFQIFFRSVKTCEGDTFSRTVSNPQHIKMEENVLRCLSLWAKMLVSYLLQTPSSPPYSLHLYLG